MEKEKQLSVYILEVYQTLAEEGYNPAQQLTGYIISGDPTYITSKANSRKKIQKVEPNELLEILLESYFYSINFK